MYGTAHSITVEELDDGSFDATCACGWEDTGYEEREDADAAGDEHLSDPEG
jgi:hypothetical protein